MDIQYCAPGKRKGNRFWIIRGRDYVEGYERKQPFEMSTGELTKEAAERVTPSLIEAWREHLIAKLNRPLPVPVVTDHSFHAASDLYLNSRPIDKPFTENYKAIVRRLTKELGAKDVADVGRQDLMNVCHKLYAKNKGSSWNKSVFVPARAILNHVAIGKTPWLNPASIPETCELVEESAVKTKAYSVDQVRHILNMCWDDEVLALCVFLFRHGLRLSDTLALCWENIDLDSRLMVYDVSKTDDPDAWVPIDHMVYDLLWTMPLKNGERKGRIFWRWKDRESVKWVKRWIQEALDEHLGQNTFHFTWHHCRHTFGFAINKADPKTRMAMMNHKDIRTTMRYDRSDLDHKREALKLLPSFYPKVVK